MAEYSAFKSTDIDSEKINNSIVDGLNKSKKTVDYMGSEVKEQPHGGHAPGKRQSLISGGPLTSYTQMLEAMDKIAATVRGTTSLEDEEIGDDENDNSAIFDELDKLYTPILIMQGYETSVEDVKESMQEAGVLTERNVIKFDNDHRLAQLIYTCALLLQKQKNTKNFQMFVKASKIRREAALNMQKDEAEAAKELAQKYLVHVSTMNPNSAARDAALKLLPTTQGI